MVKTGFSGKGKIGKYQLIIARLLNHSNYMTIKLMRQYFKIKNQNY